MGVRIASRPVRPRNRRVLHRLIQGRTNRTTLVVLARSTADVLTSEDFPDTAVRLIRVPAAAERESAAGQIRRPGANRHVDRGAD